MTRDTDGSTQSPVPKPSGASQGDVLTNPIRPHCIRPPSTPPRPPFRNLDLPEYNVEERSVCAPDQVVHSMERPRRSARVDGQEQDALGPPAGQATSEPQRKKGNRGKGKSKGKGKGKGKIKGKGKADANTTLPTVADAWRDEDEEMIFNEVIPARDRRTTRRIVHSPPAEPDVASSSTYTRSHGRQGVHSPAVELGENAFASSSMITTDDIPNTGDKRPAGADLTDVTSMNLGFKIQLELLERKKKVMAEAQVAEERQLASLAEALKRQSEKVAEMQSEFADIEKELEDLNDVKAAYERYGKRIKTR